MVQLFFALGIGLMVFIAVPFILAMTHAKDYTVNPDTRRRERVPYSPGRGVWLTGLFLGVLTFGALAAFSSFTQVERGSVQVVTRFGAVTGEVFGPGLNFKVPFIEDTMFYPTVKVTYETSENPFDSQADFTDFAVDTVTRDGQRITLSYTIRFSIDPIQTAWIAQNLGDTERIVERIVKTDSRIWARNIPKEFAAIDLYTGNIVQVMERIFAVLNPLFITNGLILDEVGIRSISFTDEYATAIEAKQIALEGVITARNEAQQAEHLAQARINLATGDAQAIEIEGAAIRRYPEVIRLRIIDTLADNISIMLLPSESNFIFGESLLDSLAKS